jgi:hypothetical protein
MSIYSEYTEAHSRPAEKGDRPWTAEELARFAAGRAVTVALAEARRAAKAAVATPTSVTATELVATPKAKTGPIILATADQTVEFRLQSDDMVLIVSKGRNWSKLRRTTQMARKTYRDLLVAGFRRW